MKCLALVAFILCAWSCKKTDDEELPLNTFTISGTHYKAAYYTAVPFWAVAERQHGIGFHFRNHLHPAGTYRVTNTADTNQDAVRVIVEIPHQGSLKTYGTTGFDKKTLTVTYDGGRMFIKLPKVWAASYSTTGTDSFEVSANLKEWL